MVKVVIIFLLLMIAIAIMAGPAFRRTLARLLGLRR